MQNILFEKTFTLYGREIACTVTELDRGIHVLLTGGDCGHIGAVSIARPDEKTITTVLPDHKEGYITEPWAEQLAEAAETVCCVVCGIHYDNASKEQIAAIMQETDRLLREVLACVRANNSRIE